MEAATLQALALLIAWLNIGWATRRILGERDDVRRPTSRRSKKRTR